VINALNDTAEEGVVTDTLTTATIPRVPTFGMANVFVDPRRAMVGVRIDLGRLRERVSHPRSAVYGSGTR